MVFMYGITGTATVTHSLAIPHLSSSYIEQMEIKEAHHYPQGGLLVERGREKDLGVGVSFQPVNRGRNH